jgi:hypothetical protein
VHVFWELSPAKLRKPKETWWHRSRAFPNLPAPRNLETYASNQQLSAPVNVGPYNRLSTFSQTYLENNLVDSLDSYLPFNHGLVSKSGFIKDPVSNIEGRVISENADRVGKGKS